MHFNIETNSNLTKVSIDTNSNLQTIGKYSFAYSNIEKIFIPSKVSKICEGAFSNCKKLIKVDIPTNSNLQLIESNAFTGTNLTEIYFPDNLKELKNEWCSESDNLTKIRVSPSNNHFIFKEDKYLLGKIDSNKDDFDKLLLNMTRTLSFTIKNAGKVPAFWKIKGGNVLGNAFKISATEGHLNEKGSVTVNITF